MNSSTKSNHINRINSDILRVLTIAIQQKMKDNLLDGVTILRVETTADLSECKVYVNDGIDALNKASGFLRNEIAQNIKMKQAPRLRFLVDKGIENAARVEELLKQIKK